MSAKNAYLLVNPYIEGSVPIFTRARNSFSAGKKLYNNISNYFTNQVDDFYMTIQNLQTKDLTHFKIGEKRNDNDVVDFNLAKLDENFNPELEKKLMNNIEKISKQSGGKHHRHNYKNNDSSSSSSSEDSDFFKFVPQPITRFTYFYLPYYKLVGLSPIDAARIFLPTFSFPINPSIEIRFDLYKY